MSDADRPNGGKAGARFGGFGARPVADIANRLLDPILRRKTGMSTALVAAWPDIVGPRLSETTRPEKLVWPPHRGEADAFEPATLIIAGEGHAVLRLQHQTGEVLSRINAFFGFHAVDRIKIVQRTVAPMRVDRRPKLRSLNPQDRTRIEDMVGGVEDEKLREALRDFAAATLARTPK